MSETKATKLQKNVWEVLKLIPRGRVTSYSSIARYLDTKATRAVASAVGKNPYAPKVPCHRVVLADGKIGNYSGGDGVKTKIEYLAQEGVVVSNGKISDFDTIFWDFDI